ncbi:MAG: ATP-dependent DNA helicase [Methanocella sp. PtaU1.Bin125]|nr:MAG: ATP-dependent DNA helicase [Methanocella sp. PtaU1.Bin125]
MEPEYQKYFPKPSCYPNQREAMDKIYRALSAQKLVLFEGACGTGKTLSALAPALAVGRQMKKKVVIATNVHQQMEQFIQEAREIRAQADIKVVVLKGKAHMCPMEKDYEECNALRENTFELLKAEKDLTALKASEKDAIAKARTDRSFAGVRAGLATQIGEEEAGIAVMRRRSCKYLREVLLNDPAPFRQWLFDGVRTPEEIVAESGRKERCGYELLKRCLKEADLVICNYHHLLDPDIAGRFLSWMDCELSGVILIFDEAHNLEQQARSHSSQTLSEYTIERALTEALNLGVRRRDDVEFFFALLKRTIVETYTSRFSFGEAERIGHAWVDVTIRDPYSRDDLLRERLLHELAARKIDHKKMLEAAIDRGIEIEARFHKDFKEGRSDVRKSSSLLAAASFMLSYFGRSDSVDYYPVLNVRRSREGQIYGRIELFSCIPTDVTKPLLGGAFGAVLMSATLRPFEMVKATLGIERATEELSYGTTFPPERRRTLAVDLAPQFARNRDDPATVNALIALLEDVINTSEGNVLIFFPSSWEAKKYAGRLNVRVPVFVDEAGVSAQDTKLEFFRHGEDGKKAVLISYLWGTLTEGVDYKFDRCRTVVVVGVGFPSLNDRMKAIQHAYDTRFGSGKGWDYGVLYPTVRRIRQACGRVVRSPADFGIRILADARFTHASVAKLRRFSIHMQFPEDERREFVDVRPEKVKYSMMNFFGDIRGASAGEGTTGAKGAAATPDIKAVPPSGARGQRTGKGLKDALAFTTSTLRKQWPGQ